MLRNTELRIAIWASLALMLVTACLLQPISTAAMLITFITQGMLLTIYLLLSRMRSVQRRYHRQEEDIVQIQYLSIYPKQGKVYREQEEVLLTALEYRLLMVFINHPQQVLSRSQLLEGIWDAAGDFVNDNTLTVYIKRLREKLERDPQNPSIIVTVRGLGYRLELHHAA